MTLADVMEQHPGLTPSGFKFSPTDAERAELAAQGAAFRYCADWLEQLTPGRTLQGAKPCGELLKMAARTAPVPLSLGVMIAAVIADGRSFRWRRNSGDGDIVTAATGDFVALKKG